MNVRVLDRHGQPVTDLRKEDFAIVEGGVRQHISFFGQQTLVAGQPDPDLPLALLRTRTSDFRLQDRRVFFVVFGRHWLPRAEFGMVEAVTRFLRERLLPQDYAAVSAFGRATEITTDHDAVARVVERLHDYLESIEGSGERINKTRALYSGSPAIQGELDAVFEVGSVAGRSLPPRVDGSEIRDLLRQIDGHAAAVASAANPPNVTSRTGGGSGGDMDARGIGQAAKNHVLNIFSAIQYLRRMEGEKHLLYFPQGALQLPALEDDRGLARVASDARVAIHVILTTGLPASLARWGGLQFLESTMATKNVAELTGGLAYTNQWPDRALAHIDVVTRGGYVLGYYPSNATLDGRHRKLKVTVARPPGARVVFRQSYLATDTLAPCDERPFIVQDRIMTAAEYDREIPDIAVKVTASAKHRAVGIKVQIDLSRVTMEARDDRHMGLLEVAFFCTDARERLVGQVWQTLDLRLKDETYRRALTGGFFHATDVPVEDTARYVKVVVYDQHSDRVGSAIVSVY